MRQNRRGSGNEASRLTRNMKRRFKAWKARWIWSVLWPRRAAVLCACVFCCAVIARPQQPTLEPAAGQNDTSAPASVTPTPNDTSARQPATPAPSPEEQNPSQSSSFAPQSTAASVPETPMTIRKRIGYYLRSTYGPAGLLGPGAGAMWSQWRSVPEEWGPSWPGFGRRFASGYGRQMIANTIALGVAAADHEIPYYQPSNLQGVFPRARYAFIHSFIARTDRGGVEFNYSRVIGAYSAAFASNAWYPGRLSNNHEALMRGSSAMLGHIISNEFHEFVRFHKK